MTTLHVVTGVDDKGEENYDEFTGPQVTFLTEPSGALVIFQKPNHTWAAYAPGQWRVVRDGSASQVPQ